MQLLITITDLSLSDYECIKKCPNGQKMLDGETECRQVHNSYKYMVLKEINLLNKKLQLF